MQIQPQPILSHPILPVPIKPQARIRLPNDWNPRPYQRPLWDYLERGGKRAVAVWHRRAGKDDVFLHRTAIAALTERVGNYWHMLPMANQARRALWEAINPHTGRRRIDDAFPPSLRDTTRENEMTIRFINGSVWQVVGSDNYNALVGAPPVGIVFSEWPLADPRAWAFLRPILAENGGWAGFGFTPRGPNHGLDTLNMARSEPTWFSEVLTVGDTGVFDAVTLARERRELIKLFGPDQGESLFQQEYYCSFDAAILGAYYIREMAWLEREKRVTRVPWDPAVSVHTAWDLGIGDSTVIWFAQFVGREVHLIDYVANSGVGLSWYVNELRNRPYAYGEHVLPHDADAHELGTGQTRIETLRSLGVSNTRVLPRQAIPDGIQAVRNLLPRCWIDAEKCATGVHALKQYRREYDEGRKIFHDRPFHDFASHPADALRTLAMGQPKDRTAAKLIYSNKGIV